MFFRRNGGNARNTVACSPSRRPTSFRPAVEALEGRDVPSSTSYADTAVAWGTGAGIAGTNTFYDNMQGTLKGALPGSLSTHVLYSGALGRGTNTITGGTLSAGVSGWGVPAGTLQGRLTGGSIQWSTSSNYGTVSITISITGGTGAYAGDTGWVTLRGTMDRTTQVLSCSLSLSLTRTGSPPPAPPPAPPPSGSTTYTETLNATGKGAGIAGSNTFFLDMQGTLAGRLTSAFAARLYYTSPLGNGTNPITGRTWSANIGGTTSTTGTLQGRISGGSIRWSSAGHPGAVTLTFSVTGGTGAYAGRTGTATFQGAMDWYSEALSGTLTLTLK
jgi:hypothetical protein